MSGGHKPIPQKLEDDLNNVKLYKQSSQPRMSQDAENIDPTARPTRRPSGSGFAHMFDDSAERAMYDEILGPLLKPKGKLPAGSGYEATRLSAKLAQQANNPVTNTSVSTPTDFTTTILQRLKNVEAEAKDSRTKLAVQITKNQELEEEIKTLKDSKQDPSAFIKEIKSLKDENQKLKRQIVEMEEFLADYGLEWVGNSDSRSGGQVLDDLHERLPGGHAVSYPDLLKCIQELNSIIYSEPTQVIKQERKARLANASELVDRIRVIYYRNGLMIKRGPFRPCESPSYLSFVQDIMDGYFPSEFRKEYPDGVTFELIDKQDIEYIEGKTNIDDQMSAQQFLNRLPKTVVRNGEIIDVRNEINFRLLHADQKKTVDSKETDMLEESFGEGSMDLRSSSILKSGLNSVNSSVSITSSSAKHPNCGKIVTLATEASTQSKDPSSSSGLGNTVRIQVKWIDYTTLIAVMHEMSTIRDVKHEIMKHVTTLPDTVDMRSIEFRTAFPPKILMDAMTLHECGLVPSGTIHTRQL